MYSSLILIMSMILVVPFTSGNDDPIEDDIEQTSRGTRDGLTVNITDISIATFIGESWGFAAGRSTRGVGDLNGDGFDDFIVAKSKKDETIWEGKLYLIFGKKTGWSFDINLSKSDATFGPTYHRFYGGGDINGDSFDDLLIGDPYNDDGGTDSGKVYLFLGKASGWKKDISMSEANATFEGEYAGDELGSGYETSFSIVPDLNGDGFDDIALGAFKNDDGGDSSGKVYLIFGRRSGWSGNIDLSRANASFIGENAQDCFGDTLEGLGDVNGDGLGDLAMAAAMDSDRDQNSGQVYILFGKRTGWSKGITASQLNASYIGEGSSYKLGQQITIAGDINGDDMNDIALSSDYRTANKNKVGQIYLIFGKEKGWEMDVNISEADASFLGENDGDYLGITDFSDTEPAHRTLSGGGDLNDDGYDDVLVSSQHSPTMVNKIGYVHIIFGRPGGWSKNISISKEFPTPIQGEIIQTNFGHSVSNAGDVNGDGIDEFVVGAPCTFENGRWTGKTFLASGSLYTEPTEVYSIGTYSDPEYKKEMKTAKRDDLVYIELKGLDGNASHMDRTHIYITNYGSLNKTLILLETTVNSGTYQSMFRVPAYLDYPDNLTFVSFKDPSKRTTLLIHIPLMIQPSISSLSWFEDRSNEMHFRYIGYSKTVQWSVRTNAHWIGWDDRNHDLSGTPDNSRVGLWWVDLLISDTEGNVDEVNITLNVLNRRPSIMTDNLESILQDHSYFMDYQSDDEGAGNTHWEIARPQPSWLDFDESTGILNGTPGQEDIGLYDINISFYDGNGGSNWTVFKLEVIDVNDPPRILTVPITSIYQGTLYYVSFNVEDIDNEYTFTWNLTTNAKWLSLNASYGAVNGIPSDEDVGTSFVNVSVTDQGGLSDFINYTIEVIDVNDPPQWTTVPIDLKIEEGELLEFDIDAIDFDGNEQVTYRLETDPEVGIMIDGLSGLITWTASLKNIEPTPYYLVQAVVYASDGMDESSHFFTIDVIPNPTPTTTLLSPADDELVPTTGTMLEWSFRDDSQYVWFDIYLSEDRLDLLQPGPGVLLKFDHDQTTLFVDDIDPGKTYYWTVIPKDLFSTGLCSNSIHKFRVNTLPALDPISNQTATIGRDWNLQLSGSDRETKSEELEISLISGPDGMELLKTTGFLVWTPVAEQVGEHSVTISIFDGMEGSNTSFTVSVSALKAPQEPADNGSDPSVLILILAIFLLILLLAGSAAFILIKRGRSKKDMSHTGRDEHTPQVQIDQAKDIERAIPMERTGDPIAEQKPITEVKESDKAMEISPPHLENPEQLETTNLMEKAEAPGNDHINV